MREGYALGLDLNRFGAQVQHRQRNAIADRGGGKEGKEQEKLKKIRENNGSGKGKSIIRTTEGRKRYRGSRFQCLEARVSKWSEIPLFAID